MKWFKHLTNAHDGKDLTKVRAKYGAEGYAVYWYCLELIAGDLGNTDRITFELRHDAEVIGHNLKVDSVRVEEIMRFMVGLGLFENSAGVITCLKLAKYLDKNTTRNEKIREIIDAGARLSGTIPDMSGPFRLDRDTDRDTEKEKRGRFAPPSLPEVKGYCSSRKNDVDPDAFVAFYESKGWMVGKNKMKDWKAAIRTWERRDGGKPNTLGEIL